MWGEGNEAVGMTSIHEKLQVCSLMLSHWSKEKFGYSDKILKYKTAMFENL
jgi:hypothetical protein